MAVATLDFNVRPEDGWVLVATAPDFLFVRPSTFHPWYVAVGVSTPATGYVNALTTGTFSGGNANDGGTVTLDGIVYTFNTLRSGERSVTIGGNAEGSIDNLVAAIMGGLPAVAASGVLTVTDEPTEGEEVEIGGITYTFTASPAAEYDVLIGATVEDNVDALVAAINGANGVAATAVLTVSGTVTPGEVVSIDGTTYTFVDDDDDPETGYPVLQQWEVRVGTAGAAEGSIDNLVLAINGQDVPGTPPLAIASAAKTSASTMTVTARQQSADDNGVPTSTDMANGAWGGNLAGGITPYTPHPEVTAAKTGSDDEVTVTAILSGADGNGITTSTDAADSSWGGNATLIGGADAFDPHPTLNAAKLTAATFSVTAKASGTLGNGTVVSENTNNLAFSPSGALAGGTDPVRGVAMNQGRPPSREPFVLPGGTSGNVYIRALAPVDVGPEVFHFGVIRDQA